MKNAWRRLVVYIRYDLREIIAPSSLPDPAGVQPERRLTLQEWRQLWSETWRDYKASWKPTPPDEPDAASEAEQAEGGVSGAQLRDDIGVISRGGAAQLRPILQRMYAERLAALQDAGRAFVDGYRGGLEKAKEDTLLEDLADKLWRQTTPTKTPTKEPEHGAEAASSSPQQPQRGPLAEAAAAKHPSDVQHGAAATSKPAKPVDVAIAEGVPSAAHQHQ